VLPGPTASFPVALLKIAELSCWCTARFSDELNQKPSSSYFVTASNTAQPISAIPPDDDPFIRFSDGNDHNSPA
jgi:hypothetical protein